MDCLRLYFTAPGQVEVRQESVPPPGPGELLVQTAFTGISAGTEMLLYRGHFPQDLSLDENLPALSGTFRYPLSYGYSAVGQVVEAGAGVDPAWIDRMVFAFHPHATHFIAKPEELMPVPAGIGSPDAVFLPNMETAVNLVMDGAPMIGEQVVIFGQGMVGLLTTALLARFPITSLIALDRIPLRRQAALELGAHIALDPGAENEIARLHSLQPQGADLVYELSGSPATLDQAIAAAGYAGRVVIGSWYGQKRASLDLGGRFHRSRIRLMSSQVSTLNPELSGRWTKARRFEVTWEMLRLVKPARFITQRVPFAQAGQAYQLIEQTPEKTIQVVLTC